MAHNTCITMKKSALALLIISALVLLVLLQIGL